MNAGNTVVHVYRSMKGDGSSAGVWPIIRFNVVCNIITENDLGRCLFLDSILDFSIDVAMTSEMQEVGQKFFLSTQSTIVLYLIFQMFY